MGLLNYQNLTHHRPDVLMKKTFDGLKNFYDFLTRSKKYLESDAAVKRLAWKPAVREPKAGNEDEPETGFWIQLTEPLGRPNEPETTFRAFLVDDIREIYESVAINKNQSNERISFARSLEIKVLDRDPQSEQILLEREPKLPNLALRPNTWPITCQINALQTLQDIPSQNHRPLLRLFEAKDHAKWPDLPANRNDTGFTAPFLDEFKSPVETWQVLTDENKPGTIDQRKFVSMTINTPDFAFLEGPPGSGKTTAICELILQLAAQNKRVLLCASTHVAVDNVLERLMDEQNTYRDQIIPIRIGDKSSVSEKAACWQLETFIQTEKQRLLKALNRHKPLAPSQNELLKQLNSGKDVIERMVLESSNLVCGTTIGLLQHPDIKKKGKSTPQFDVMIIDEASKTTFQEFLVPALLAKRWVLVGDPKQLSPYVDDETTAINLEPCLPDEQMRNACVDVFFAARRNQQRRTTVIATDSASIIKCYDAQAEKHHVDLVNADTSTNLLPIAGIVVGSAASLERQIDKLPLDITHIRSNDEALTTLRRRVASYTRLVGQKNEALPLWQKEIAWRLESHYEQRQNNIDESNPSARKLQQQLEDLLPVNNAPKIWQNIDAVRRVALPSVLESLQDGFERNAQQRSGSALTDGLPHNMLRQRHVLLSYQHRMHPEIADFPHRTVYQGKALLTPDSLVAKRSWNYHQYSKRTVWFTVNGQFNKQTHSNEKEAKQLLEHLKLFDLWAKDHRQQNAQPWQLAILTFYRGQELTIRQLLQKWSGSSYAKQHFHRGDKIRPYLSIQLCTVDRFQGHEADLVFLSFANTFATHFLQSPNRLNVALTRARYQLVVFGDRNRMKKAPGILGQYAEQANWSTKI